jgi:OOP family OmpA-OmpF porin
VHRYWGDVVLALTTLLVAVPTVATAQVSFPTEEFSAVTYHPATGTRDYLMVHGARVSGEYALPPMQIVLDHSAHPLEIPTDCSNRMEVPCAGNGERAALVSGLTLFHLMGSYTFLERFEVGLDIPLAISSSDGLIYRGSPLTAGTRGGMADWRVSGKAHIWGDLEVDRLGVSTLVWLTIPFGQLTTPGGYVGDEHPGFGGFVIGEYLHSDRFRLALNIGGYYRPVRTTLASQVGPMLSYAIAADYLATDPANLIAVNLLAELTGSTGFGNDLRGEQLELRVAGKVGYGAVFGSLGLGFGLVDGPGVPDFRFTLAVGYAAEVEKDSDGDGLVDGVDACPAEPEDQDGFADEDGCPERDNDGDGIADADDQCPDDPEDIDEKDDEDGCPDADNDGDGVDDSWDSCPNTPEDMDGDRDGDGCPETDTDRDGVDDEYDACPNRPEDTDGLGDEDGCPETDFDMDRVPDHRDECPEDPEDRDRYRDRDGCPEPGGRIHAVPASDLHAD